MSMSKRTVFTNITPLPAGVTRDVVLRFLHNHEKMIDLNPLVIDRSPIPPPPHASAEEQACVWYTITDRIKYVSGGWLSGDVNYTCAFHDLPTGLQTHCFAAMGVDIRDKWTVGGSMPGEPPETQELGLNAPKSGLYLREDLDFKCNVLMASFVKKTLKKSHSTLVEALAKEVGWHSTSPREQFEREQLESGNKEVYYGPTPSSSSTSSPPPPFGTSSTSSLPGQHPNQQQQYGRHGSGSSSPFVSTGANQGQPGQAGYAPYNVPGLHEAPSGMERPYAGDAVEMDGGQNTWAGQPQQRR